MRKIILNDIEMNKYETIKKLVETNGNKKRAALKLNLSLRQINRLIIVYKTRGKEGFLHGNHGKKPIHTISNDIKNLIINLYNTKYQGANICHFVELLRENENLDYSYNFVYSLLRTNSILSPKVHRRTIKNEKKRIKALMENKKKLSEEDKNLIVKNNILSKYDSHSRVPRLKYFGECLELDASKEYWIDQEKWTLHGAIDNSTGAICGLYFDKEETLNGYYHLFERIWHKFGVPAKFLTDNRTVFVYKGLKQKSMDKDTLTQFSYACSQLGVEIETTSIPEKKSRIERLWQTLQSRLPILLKLAGIHSIEEANKFLPSFIDEFNQHFSLPIDYTTSVFEKPDVSLINSTLSIISKRVFDKGCSIKYKNKIYQAYRYNKQMNYCRGTRCLVIETFDGKLLCNVDDELSVLYELETHQRTSNEFDVKDDNKPKERKGSYIPPLSHPWKQLSFMNYLSTRKGYRDSAYD